MDKETDQLASTVTSAEGGAAYAFDIDVESDSTHARVVRLVGRDRRVLELGPATGYMSRTFQTRNCSVVAIELDEAMATEAAEYCERMIVGDLDELDLEAELNGDRFDVIVAADVLEHLKDPLDALRRLRAFLAPEGFFVISVPNVAHGSVRLALLEGHFQYQKLGLLDETHLRFFTRESVERLLDEAELGIAEIHYQQLDIGASEVRFDRSAVPPALLEALEQDPSARTYQFVIKALPFALPGMRELQRQMRELAAQVAGLREENARLDESNSQLRDENTRIVTSELRELQEALAAITGREGQLRKSLLDAHDQLFQRDQEITELRAELLPLRILFDRLRGSPVGRVYLKLRRLRNLSSKVSRRMARYRAALRKL